MGRERESVCRGSWSKGVGRGKTEKRVTRGWGGR